MASDLEKLVGLLEKNPELVNKILELTGGADESVTAAPPGEAEFVCSNCGHSIFLKKPKKVCPACKKHKLQLVLKDVKPAVRNKNDLSDFTRQIKGAGNPLDKRLAKREQIGKFTNEFVDNEKLCSEDSKIDKLLWKNASVSPRPSTSRTITVAKCILCNKQEEVPKIVTSGGKDYICNQCVIAAKGRQGQHG